MRYSKMKYEIVGIVKLDFENSEDDRLRVTNRNGNVIETCETYENYISEMCIGKFGSGKYYDENVQITAENEKEWEVSGYLTFSVYAKNLTEAEKQCEEKILNLIKTGYFGRMDEFTFHYQGEYLI